MNAERRKDGHVTRRFVVAISIEWNDTDEQFADVAEVLMRAIMNDTEYDVEAIWLER